MRGRRLIAALVIAIFGAVPGVEDLCWGQQGAATPNGGAASTNGAPATPNGGAAGAKGTDGKPQPPKVGSYSLVITTLEPTATTHWLNPPPAIDVTAGTKLAPAETKGNLTAPQQYTIEAFDVPRQECEETAPQQHGCDALDRTDLTIRDANTVEYRIVSHGVAVQLHVNLQVHDLLPVARGGPSTDWHTGDVIFVSVPKATPVYRFVSETLVGVWNGEPIVFEAGKALPDSAKKGLEDLSVHQDLGDALLYSYRVK
jgi:hypothetical protein